MLLYSLLALGMEVYAIHTSMALIETDVVEPFEARATDGFDLVIWHEKVFLPPHEQVFPLGVILIGK